MPTLIKLLAESALHRAIFDACAIPIVLVDMRAEEHPVILSNPAFETTFGIAAKTVQGRPLADALFGGRRDPIRQLLGSPASRIPIVATPAQGMQLACEATAGMVRSSRGDVQYAVIALSKHSDASGGKLESAVAALTCATA